MTTRRFWATGSLLTLLLVAPDQARAQQTGIPDGSALGGSVGWLWVNDTADDDFTLFAFRWSRLRQRRVSFELEAALASGEGLDGADLTLGAMYHRPLKDVSLLFGGGATAIAASGGDDAGGALGLQIGTAVLVPVGRGVGLRFDGAWRRYFTGGDGFDAWLVGVGVTSLPHPR